MQSRSAAARRRHDHATVPARPHLPLDPVQRCAHRDAQATENPHVMGPRQDVRGVSRLCEPCARPAASRPGCARSTRLIDLVTVWIEKLRRPPRSAWTPKAS